MPRPCGGRPGGGQGCRRAAGRQPDARGSPDATDRAGRARPAFLHGGRIFTRVALPDALGSTAAQTDDEGTRIRASAPITLDPPFRHAVDPHRSLLPHPPIDAHPGLPAVIAARIHARWPDATDRAVLLVGHGSARAPGRVMAAHRDVQTLRATHAFAAVELAFLEEPPFVADSLVRIGDRPTVVLGLLANHGTHARDDLPALLTAADTRRHPPILLGIIGDDPGLQPVILAMINATPGA